MAVGCITTGSRRVANHLQQGERQAKLTHMPDSVSKSCREDKPEGVKFQQSRNNSPFFA
jgi:hypothetical protein